MWGKSCLESNPVLTTGALKAQTKTCAHQETPQRMSQTCLWVFKCLLRRFGSAVASHRGRGSGCSRPGSGISPLGGGRHEPPREPPELTQDWGSRPLEAQTEPCAQDPGERSSGPTGGWPRLARSVQESPAEAWVSGGLRQGRGRWAWPCMRGTFWRRSPFSSLPPPLLGQTTGREHSHAHQQKIGLKIYWAWLHPSESGPVSPSVSLSL